MTRFSRRQFLAGSAALGLTGTLAATPRRLWAGTAATTILRAETRQIDVGGRAATVYGLRQPNGWPGLVATVGEDFSVSLENHLSEPTLVHWHGLTPPWHQDGVPDLSQPALQPGKTYEYRFPLARPGTFWMHSHLGLQEAQLLAAPLIIHDPGDANVDEQEIVVLLHDFSFRSPDEILAQLRGGAGSMAGMNMSNMGSSSGVSGMQAGQGVSSMANMPGMAGMSMDLNDIDFDAYLANDRTLFDPEVVRAERGGKIRLRIINGASSTAFWLDLGSLEGDVIAVDGDPVVPIRGRVFPITMAQRIDVRLRLPDSGDAFPVLALREGDMARTGIILAPTGAAVRKVEANADTKAPALDLSFEKRLRAAAPLPDRGPDRSIVVDLAGNMQGYSWQMLEAGRPATPMVRAGERLEIVLRNQSMMAHPIHLHGHRFQVVDAGAGRFSGAVRDTVLVPAMGSVTVAVDADNPGRWAFHCHHLYHMVSGMMVTLAYEGIG